MIKNDEYFMALAIKEAKKAMMIDEVPVGALIVDENNNIIAKAYNKRESTFDPTGHAEIIAIKKACKKIEDWRLVNCTLYVTIEPCLMCCGTIIWSRLKRVVYGAKDIKGGAIESIYRVFDNPLINHHPEIKCDVLNNECAELIKTFFKHKRKKI